MSLYYSIFSLFFQAITSCRLFYRSYLKVSFLEHSLDNLTKFDISRIIIVTGYCGDEIENVIGNSYNNIPVIYVENKDYATTNNIYSLYLTKSYLEQEDTLLLESDLIYEEKIIEKLLSNPYKNLAVVDKYRAWMDGTVVKINSQDEIISFVPKEHFEYKDVDSYYKTVNIYKFSKDFMIKSYLPFLEAYCKTMGTNSYYELVLKVLLSLEKNDLRVMRLNGERWYEVDDLQDYDIAETMFCKNPTERLAKYHKRYGGYWRFDGLKDFCYLVNPYFPNPKLVEELKNSFNELLINYPSGQSVEKLLVANIWGVDEKYILVGNGAAELINILIPEIKGEIGIILPTFQEYPARIKDSAKVHYFIPQNPDFSYDVADLKEFSKEIDTLVLINPDNPSGNFIPKSELIELVEYFKAAGKNIIVDESFVDFSQESEWNTIIDNEILAQYSNLTVIKSISKSYGVPGLRLGIMATSNDDLLQKCSKNLPVWNINSFGEYFLQILNKHKKYYLSACEKIAQNRQDLYNRLCEFSFLRPIESQANYILCEVQKPYTSSELCHKLLNSNILIKDCQNKMGFEGKQYVRIAVKSEFENDELISVLKELPAFSVC